METLTPNREEARIRVDGVSFFRPYLSALDEGSNGEAAMLTGLLHLRLFIWDGLAVEAGVTHSIRDTIRGVCSLLFYVVLPKCLGAF